MIPALAAGGVDPVLLMASYATAVSAAIIGVTALVVKAYGHIQHRVVQYSKYLPKISAIILLVLWQ